jgi:hypothetical protein
MTLREWLQLRAVEMLAALCTAGVLVGGLALGVPFLRNRVAEVFLYSFCCLLAVMIRILADLVLGALQLMRHAGRIRLLFPARILWRES